MSRLPVPPVPGILYDKPTCKCRRWRFGAVVESGRFSGDSPMKLRANRHIPIIGLAAVLCVLPLPLVCDPAAAAQVQLQPGTPEQVEFFEKNIRPLLSKHCYNCHSNYATKAKNDLY